MSGRRLLQATALLLGLPALLAAQQHPSLERGFDPEKVYQFGDVDTVNLLNRNLVLQIPIGGRYPLSQNFSYGLTLTYNSKAWDFEEVFINGQRRLRIIPERFGNAGLGWSLSLGQLIDPMDIRNDNDNTTWFYLSPDGADHKFYQGLHQEGALGVDPCMPGPCYTRDGSYLRMRRVNLTTRQIDFPDGSVHTFEKVGADRWRIVSINDAFAGANDVTIGYPTTGTPRWVIQDRWNRTHTITFETDPADNARQRVTSVAVSGPSGAPSTYTFSYLPTPTIPRPCGSTTPDTTTLASILASVRLPDQSPWEMQSALPSTESCLAHGLITDLTLPTRGRIHWSWGEHVLPIPGCSIQDWFRTSVAVKSRQRFDRDGGDLGTWAYRSFLQKPTTPSSPPLNCDAPNRAFSPPYQEVQVQVTDPLSYTSVSYFSVLPPTEGIQPTSFRPDEYGLPFTRATSDGANRYLSTEIYTCPPSAVDGSFSCAPLRRSFHRWEHDPVSCGFELSARCMDTDRRQSSEKTVYVDDGNRFAATDSSDYDGFGHFRTQTTSGNFDAGNVRTTTTQYNPGNTLPSATKWILGTYTEQTVQEGDTQKSQFCFDSETGFLRRQRIYLGANANAKDVIRVYEPDSQGNVASEKDYGGDTGSVPTGDVCTAALSGESYRIDHTWPDPLRASDPWLQTSKYVRANGTALAYLTRDETVDPANGLVVQSRDSAGIATSYEYDALGRLLWEKPQLGDHDGWTKYLYIRAQAGNPANVKIERRGNGSETAPVLAESQVFFDGFGRLFQEKQRLPGGWNLRETRYDKAGNKASVSELQPDGTTAQKTLYLGYDPFGRPATLQPPNSVNGRHDTTFVYKGVRTVERTVKIGSAFNTDTGGINLTDAKTTETYDRQGRLWKVAEPAGGLTATYSYDEGNRLTQVLTTGGGTQTRSFSYDNRGFLTSETHPEKDGTVVYSGYDARGHATRKQDGPSDLAFTYDRGEKLTEIREGPGGRKLKSFTYGTSNGDLSNGKVIQASRFNYVLLGGNPMTAEIRQGMTYLGRGGRVSARTLENRVNGQPPVESFHQEFAYNELGLRQTVTYPVCSAGACPQPGPVFADVAANHQNRLAIEALFRAGVTNGCGVNPAIFCPEGKYNREQMAFFLIKAKEGPAYQPPACVTPAFADVPCSSQFAAWVNEFARRGITNGCGGGLYCPATIVNQATMAVFLLRTLEGGNYQPPPVNPTAPRFPDVPSNYQFADFIEDVARRGIWPGCAGGNFCPGDPVFRREVAEQLTRAFDIPLALDPLTQRTVTHTYTHGFLTNVAGYASLTYHPNGLVDRISHPNGTVDLQGNDPNALRRPSSITARVNSVDRWKTGGFNYDGAGNVTQMGQSWFLYDPVQRLKKAHLLDGALDTGTVREQTYTYDAFGNLTAMAGANGRNIPVSSANNRLSGTGTSYDAAGNLKTWNGHQYTWDAFHQMTGFKPTNQDEWLYVYDANDERVWSYKTDNTSRWTLRDLDGLVLRELVNQGGAWSREADHIYRDGLLLASETNTGQRHYSLDHLGTPRLITDGFGTVKAYHLYYPYGEELTAFDQDTGRMKFTGHERDLANPGGAGDDLDYMHARHASPLTGRFLSGDTASGIPRKPQSWNRYSYTLGNPLKYTDPDGRLTQLAYGHQTPNNVFGHVALVVNGTVYSYGTYWAKDAGDWGVPLQSYLEPQGNRATELITLDLSASQEEQLQQTLQSENPYESGGPYNIASKTCVTFSEEPLEKVGALSNQPGPVTIDRAGNELQAGAPKSFTPAGLAARVQGEGLAKGIQMHGSEVSKLRALIGTARAFLRRISR